MRSRIVHLELVGDEVDSHAFADRSESNHKRYARVRSARSPRRRTSRSAGANVPLGISARRNRRWAW